LSLPAVQSDAMVEKVQLSANKNVKIWKR